MNLELITGMLLMVAGALTGGAVLGRALLRYRNRPDAGEPALGFSAARYEVMARLTCEEDLDYLRKLPGFRENMTTRLRKQRRRILRMYLRELAADFRVLHARARRLVAVAPEEHAPLVGFLLRQQVTFWLRLARIEVGLSLAPVGMGTGDVRALVRGLEAIHAAITPAGPAVVPARA